MLTKELLIKNDIGKSLSAACIDHVYPILAQNSFRRTFSPGDALHHIGDQIRYITILEKGVARSYTYTQRGEQILFFLSRNLHEMEREGLIGLSAGVIRILDIDRLTEQI